MPEAIIVGIGYGGKGREEMFNWALGRTRDLTPVKSAATRRSIEKGLRLSVLQMWKFKPVELRYSWIL